MAGLEPRIAELTTHLLDRAGERFDLIDALAYPLPVIVIAELLGIPISDQALFRKWADVLLGQDVDPDSPWNRSASGRWRPSLRSCGR